MDFDEKAREIAHRHSSKCTGGRAQGDDGRRYHSASCDNLTFSLKQALSEAYEQGRKSENEECAKIILKLKAHAFGVAAENRCDPQTVTLFDSIARDHAKSLDAIRSRFQKEGE